MQWALGETKDALTVPHAFKLEAVPCRMVLVKWISITAQSSMMSL